MRQHIKTLSEDWNTQFYDEHTGFVSPPEETNAYDVTVATRAVQDADAAQEAQVVPDLPEIEESEDEDWTSFFSGTGSTPEPSPPTSTCCCHCY